MSLFVGGIAPDARTKDLEVCHWLLGCESGEDGKIMMHKESGDGLTGDLHVPLMLGLETYSYATREDGGEILM